jgi:hypothetical protein
MRSAAAWRPCSAAAFRTCKTCVGTDFCRYGVGDSTGLGLKLLTVMAQEGLLDETFLVTRTCGFGDALAAAQELSLGEAADACDVAPDEI